MMSLHGVFDLELQETNLENEETSDDEPTDFCDHKVWFDIFICTNYKRHVILSVIVMIYTFCIFNQVKM